MKWENEGEEEVEECVVGMEAKEEEEKRGTGEIRKEEGRMGSLKK